MLNLLVDIISFPVKMIKKIPNKNLGGFIPLRFLVAVIFAGISAACYITYDQGYHRFIMFTLFVIFALAVIDVFWYANAEEKAIESEEKANRPDLK